MNNFIEFNDYWNTSSIIDYNRYDEIRNKVLECVKKDMDKRKELGKNNDI